MITEVNEGGGLKGVVMCGARPESLGGKMGGDRLQLRQGECKI